MLGTVEQQPQKTVHFLFLSNSDFDNWSQPLFVILSDFDSSIYYGSNATVYTGNCDDDGVTLL